MAKTNAQKKEYRECLKAKDNSDYLKKDREGKKAKKDMLKNSPAQCNEYKKRDRERKTAKKVLAEKQHLNHLTHQHVLH